jgi:hypothetical protein
MQDILIKVLNFHLDVNAFIPRLVWMTEQNYWGGQLGFYAIQPMVDLRLSAAGMSDHNTALGDLMLGSRLVGTVVIITGLAR